MAVSRKFGKAVDLTRLMSSRSKLKPRVAHVGIELEGGWSKMPDPYILQHDGSISGLPRDYVRVRDMPPGWAGGVAGELPSPILGMGEWPDWVRKYYPAVTNSSCGMHVHMSFNNALYYMKCMDPRLPATVVDHFSRWAGDMKLADTHPIWSRLRGESRFCQHVFSADEQITVSGKDFDQTRNGHRYTVFNYPYSRTGTVECRLLPMMDTADRAVEAIQELIDVTNAFLVATAQREQKLQTKLEADLEEAPQVRQIYIRG